MKNRIMATLLAFYMVLALLPGTALAATTVASGKCGTNATWALDSSGTLTIKGSGNMDDYMIPEVSSYGSNSPWYSRRGDVVRIFIESGITGIGRYAFANCSNVTSVTIKGASTIAGQAFYKCSNLTSLTFPISLKTIETAAFSECNRLKNIYYDGTEEQWNRISISNNCQVFFASGVRIHYAGSPDTTSLISGQCGQSVTFSIDGNGVLMIRGFGSMNNTDTYHVPWYYRSDSIKKIVINEDVISIGTYAFDGCKNVTSISIPTSIVTIENRAFLGCNGLEHVYYSGTEDQWNEINIDSSNNAYLFASTVQFHYNSSGGTETPVTYTVTLDATGGTASKTSLPVVKGGMYAGLPSTATRAGYTFKGWYTAKTGGTRITALTKVTASGAHTLYAQWTKSASTAKTMTVTFNPNSGTVSPKTATVTNGQTYGTLPEPTRTGYKFDGWYTTSTGGTKVTSSTKVTKTANHTLYAHWTKVRTFNVTLDANGGTVLTEYLAVTTNTRYRHLPTPTRSGYHFSGWYTAKTGGTKVTESTKVSNSVTKLYARWVKTNPTVKSRQTGSYQIVIPGDYKVLLHSSETTAAVAKTAAAQASDYTVTCTKMAKLSNGTVRYYGKFTKVSSSTSYWFTYTDEMFIN